MDSFKVSMRVAGADKNVLVIPDDCADQSIFHIVVEDEEYCKVAFTAEHWEQIEGRQLSDDEMNALTKLIEEQFH